MTVVERDVFQDITFFNLIVQAIFFFLFFLDVMLDRQRFSTKNQVQ